MTIPASAVMENRELQLRARVEKEAPDDQWNERIDKLAVPQSLLVVYV